MGLQVRLRHALGERLLDLPDRTAESPLLLGRAKEVDLKIPSVTVATKHCALFLHDNQWVLQDTSGGATWINGNPVSGPTPLHVGDVITLGSDASPASVEIDPAGAAQGRAGQPAESEEAAPQAPVRQAPARPVPRQPSSHYAAAPVRYAPPPPPPQMQQPVASADPWGSSGGESEDPFAGWQQPAADSATPSASTTIRRKKPSKQTSQGALFGGIFVSLVIVGGTIWAVYVKLHPAPPPPVQADAAPPPTKYVYGKQASIFSEHKEGEVIELGGKAGQTPKAAAPTPTPAPAETSAPPPPADAPSAAADPDAPPPSAHKDDKDWVEVEAANNKTEVGQAILKFDDYRRQHPGQNTKELDDLTNAAMDRLWWKRIADLCQKRDQLKKDIRAKEKDVKDEPNPAFRKTLVAEKEAKDKDLQHVMDHLTTEMGFGDEQAPDLDNPDQIKTLTAARDQGKFNDWKLHTLKFIRSQHGATPWDGE